MFGRAYRLGTEHVQRRADLLARHLGFTRFHDQRIDRLSGGNRRKVDLSVALLHDPDVLLLGGSWLELMVAEAWAGGADTFLAVTALTSAALGRVLASLGDRPLPPCAQR